jgi:hypothetical protein
MGKLIVLVWNHFFVIEGHTGRIAYCVLFGLPLGLEKNPSIDGERLVLYYACCLELRVVRERNCKYSTVSWALRATGSQIRN